MTVVRPASKCGISVSGKATGKSVDIKGDRLFALIISYKFSDGTHENKVIPFNPDTFGEQFTSKAVYPSSANLSKTVSFITLYAGYYQNANSVQFDDLQLIFDETGTSYTYDSNGNLINAIDNGQRNSTYNFSNANELTSATNPDNTNYTYKYGEGTLSHRLLSARSTNMQLEFAFSYDSNGNVTKTEMYNNVTPGVRPTTTRSVYTETTYTTDGNYVASQTDDHGRIVSANTYNTAKGTLLQNTDGNGNVTKYSYNANNDRLTETKAVDKTDNSIELAKNTYTYTGEDLTGITAGVGSDTVNYTFTYDTYGNQQNVKVGTQSLITNTYAERNGVLASSLYGNSDTVTYTYDGYDRIKTIKYNGDTENRFEYYYNAEGKLAKTVDNENGVMYTHMYCATN